MEHKNVSMATVSDFQPDFHPDSEEVFDAREEYGKERMRLRKLGAGIKFDWGKSAESRVKGPAGGVK